MSILHRSTRNLKEPFALRPIASLTDCGFRLRGSPSEPLQGPVLGTHSWKLPLAKRRFKACVPKQELGTRIAGTSSRRVRSAFERNTTDKNATILDQKRIAPYLINVQ